MKPTLNNLIDKLKGLLLSPDRSNGMYNNLRLIPVPAGNQGRNHFPKSNA